MLKLKKSLLTITIISLFSLLLSTFCFASEAQPNEKEKKTIYKAEEIKDFDKLLERAQKGKGDLSPFEIKSESKFINKETKEAKKVETYKTIQLLEVITDGQETEEKYAATVIDIVNIDVSPMGTGSENDYTWDGDTFNVKAYSTIYYSYLYDDAGNKYYKMTRGTGGWEIHDPSVSISGRNVYLAQMGVNRNGGLFATYDMPIQYPSLNSFSYNTGTNWDYVMLGFGGSALRLDSNVVVKRGTSTWQLNHKQRYTT